MSAVPPDEQCEMRFGKSKLARKHGYGTKNSGGGGGGGGGNSGEDKSTTAALLMPLELKKAPPKIHSAVLNH